LLPKNEVKVLKIGSLKTGVIVYFVAINQILSGFMDMVSAVCAVSMLMNVVEVNVVGSSTRLDTQALKLGKFPAM